MAAFSQQIDFQYNWMHLNISKLQQMSIWPPQQNNTSWKDICHTFEPIDYQSRLSKIYRWQLGPTAFFYRGEIIKWVLRPKAEQEGLLDLYWLKSALTFQKGHSLYVPETR